MPMLRRWLPRMVMLVAAVGLIAGLPSESRAAEPTRSAAPAAVEPRVMPLDARLRTLPAPRTPDDHHAGPGPRAAWPVRGTVTQLFGCTGFSLERPAADCPGGFHLGLDIAQPQGTPIRAAAAGLAYPMADPPRYGNLVIIQHYGGAATGYRHMVPPAVSSGPAGRQLGPAGPGRRRDRLCGLDWQLQRTAPPLRGEIRRHGIRSGAVPERLAGRSGASSHRLAGSPTRRLAWAPLRARARRRRPKAGPLAAPGSVERPGKVSRPR